MAQDLMYEIPLKDQVAASSQIVEGKVISKKSFWNSNKTAIYTYNTIEVYKVFKGEKISVIDVITLGGTVGLKAQIVNPSLKLRKGEVGVFTLTNNQNALISSKGGNRGFKPYSTKQGFYKYNLYSNSVTNPFSKREGITSNFYTELEQLTNKTYSEVQIFDVNSKMASVKKNASSKLANFTASPTSGTAGTKTVVTLTGSGFGSSQGAGIVSFKDANDGTFLSFIDALDSEIVSWNDTTIEVEIPSDAGTGNIRVTSDGGSSMFLNGGSFIIDYAELNVISSSTGIETAYQTQHINENGSGGYTWQMNMDFDANTAANESFMRAFNTWICESNINWTIGGTTFINKSASDNINVISFDTEADPLGAGTLGVCTSRLIGCLINGDTDMQWFVSELDIIFDNDTNWYFSTGTPGGLEYDFETVAVHELGHGHQLGHVVSPGAIMHYAIGAGSSNRALSTNDMNGANDVQSRSISTAVCFETVMTNLSCPTAGLDDQLLAEGISIFPNPANSNLFISNNTYLSLDNALIYDVSGRLLLQKDISEFNKTKTIDVSSFSNGLYFINISSSEGSTTKRFIVE